MDYDTIDTDFWTEIADAPGEVWDIPELWDDVNSEQTFNDLLNSNRDF